MKQTQSERAPCHGDETPWFPGSISPVHVGPYQRRLVAVGRNWFWSWWDGERWGVFSTTLEAAVSNREYPSAYQHLSWRGLCKPASRADRGIKRF